MSKNVEPPAAAPTLPSVFDATPEVLGGIPARQGFAYQDDVAAGFYIQMLLRNDLIEVACETYDDIRLVWQRDAGKIIEFVQVKAECHAPKETDPLATEVMNPLFAREEKWRWRSWHA